MLVVGLPVDITEPACDLDVLIRRHVVLLTEDHDSIFVRVGDNLLDDRLFYLFHQIYAEHLNAQLNRTNGVRRCHRCIG